MQGLGLPRGGLAAPSGLRHTQSSSSPPSAPRAFKIFQRFRSASVDLFVGNREAFSRQCSAPVDTTMRVSAESSSADQRDGGAAVEAVLDVAISVQAGNSCRRASGLTPPGNEAAATASTKRHDLSPIIFVMTAVGYSSPSYVTRKWAPPGSTQLTAPSSHPSPPPSSGNPADMVAKVPCNLTPRHP